MTLQEPMVLAGLQPPVVETNLDIKTAAVFEPLLPHARFKGAHGGRSSGKSHFFAENLIDECIRIPGTRAVCIREIQRTLEHSSKRLIEDKIAAMRVSRKFNITDKKIETPGGGVIIFEGMQNHTADSMKSLEGFRIAWADEAHRLSSYSLGLLRPTIRSPGSELWFSWNPKGPDDPVDRFLRGSDAPRNAIVVEANYDDNPWFPYAMELEMRYDRRRDPERYKHVWLGTYQIHSEARVFRNFRIEDFETPDDAVFYYGADWGFAKDPTVLIRCFVVGRTLYVDHEIWKIGCEMDHTPALFDQLDPAHVGVARKSRIVADSSNPQSISYMRRHGYPKMEPAVKGPGSLEEGVEFLKSYDIVVHGRCPHVADELTSYSYEIDKLTERVLNTLADKKNHTIDSMRYAVEAIRRRPNPPRWGSY